METETAFPVVINKEFLDSLDKPDRRVLLQAYRKWQDRQRSQEKIEVQKEARKVWQMHHKIRQLHNIEHTMEVYNEA